MPKISKKISRNKLIVVLIVLLIISLFLAIGYSALSTVLNVDFGTVSQSVQTWEVGFEVNSSINATIGGLGPTGRECGTASTTATTATIADTTLSKPGDSCRWTLKVKNTGTIGAILNSVSASYGTLSCTKTTPTTGVTPKIVCGNITYKITSDANGNTLLAANQTIAANTYKYVYLFAVYTGSDIHSGNITQSGVSFSLVYNQN